MLLPTELVALNFTVPAMFVRASADKDAPRTAVTEPLTWIELAVIVTGIKSASAFPALSVASATIWGGLATAAPEYLIVVPARDTPAGGVPWSDQVTCAPTRLMT